MKLQLLLAVAALCLLVGAAVVGAQEEAHSVLMVRNTEEIESVLRRLDMGPRVGETPGMAAAGHSVVLFRKDFK